MSTSREDKLMENVRAMAEGQRAALEMEGPEGPKREEEPTISGLIKKKLRELGVDPDELLRQVRSTREGKIAFIKSKLELMSGGVALMMAEEKPDGTIVPTPIDQCPDEVVDHMYTIISELDRLRLEGLSPEQAVAALRKRFGGNEEGELS